MAAITTNFQHWLRDPAFPPTGAGAVTPSDTVNLDRPTRKLIVQGTGNLSALLLDGTTLTLAAVPAYTQLEVACIRVNSTGTTASGIVALY